MYTGRKEIVLFFYLYAVIELLAFFLDSGIIPSAHVSYPVRDLVVSFPPNRTRVTSSLLVVRRDLYRLGRCDVHLSADQRVRRFPVRRGRNAAFIMGMDASYR